jgi:hypothetical protein
VKKAMVPHLTGIAPPWGTRDKKLSPGTGRFLDSRPRSNYITSQLAHPRDASGCDPTCGASAVPAGGFASRSRAVRASSPPALRPACEVHRLLPASPLLYRRSQKLPQARLATYAGAAAGARVLGSHRWRSAAAAAGDACGAPLGPLSTNELCSVTLTIG